jgi:hypothetical protein
MEKNNLDQPKETRHRGPSLGIVGVTYVLLFVASLLVTGILTKGQHFPSPFDPEDLSKAFFAEHSDAVRISAFLQFAAAIPLGIFAATAVSRLQFLGMNVAGVFISLFGGFAASFFAATSAAAQWVLGQPGISANPAAIHALHLLAFATGGPGYTVFLGLLLAGISVISWFARLLPRWLVWLGLVLAVVAEFSILSLVLAPAVYLLPVARFLGFVWIIGAGFRLPKGRLAAPPRVREAAA